MPPDEQPPDHNKSLSLEAISAPNPQNVSKTPDEQTQIELLKLQCDRLGIENAGLKQNIKEREKYARYFFHMACWWVGIITILLFCEGFGPAIRFKLPETVLLAAIGSTTVNILGILYVVANYLFPKP